MLAGADGDDRPAINAAIDGSIRPRRKRVVMTGRVDEPARSWLLRNATVLAYPSLDEGFGFPLLDAMQVGVPIVASDRGSIPEVVRRRRAAVRRRRRRSRSPRNLVSAAFDDDVRAELARRGSRAAGDVLVGNGAQPISPRSTDASSRGRRQLDDRRAVRWRRRRPLPRRAAARSSTRPTRSASSTPATTPCCTAWRSRPTSTRSPTRLAGAIDPDRGWGLADESWRAMEALQRYADVRPERSTAAPTWFNLGDRDLATHFYRTARLAEGATLAEVTAEICAAWGVRQRLVPMSDDTVSTVVTLADGGDVSFQEYFVKLHHGVPVSRGALRRRRRRRPRPRRSTRCCSARRVRRDRAVEPDRVDRPDPRRSPGSIAILAAQTIIRRGHLADRRWRSAERARRPDDDRARPRAVGGRRRPAVRADRRRRW